jgi:phosphatidate cytidylyltransferase
VIFLLTVVIAPKFNHPKLLAHSLLGLLYISLSWGLMMHLWNNMGQSVLTGQPWLLPVVLIASIWINDTMAYIVGSFIGKTPFSSISPKKTWEGTIGGALLAVALVTLAGHYIWAFTLKTLLLVSSIAAVFGTAGDLFESKLKRLAGVKDSGNIMPGHGGFLDRFDSLLFATTITWLVLRLVS